MPRRRTPPAVNAKKDRRYRKMCLPSHGGPQGHAIAVKRAQEAKRIADRRQRAHELYRERKMTMREIAAELGVSVRLVHEDIHIVQEQLQSLEPLRSRAVVAEERQADIYEEVILENARLRRAKDRGIRRDAHETLLQAMRDEQRFYGLGKRDEAVPAGMVVELVMGLTGQFMALFAELVEDEKLRRRWGEEVRQRVRARLGVALDVAPGEPGGGTDAPR